MWPYKRGRKLPGISKDNRGEYTFDFTVEEREAINKAFNIFDEKYIIHEKFADQIQNVTIAFALSNYAIDQVYYSKTKTNKKIRFETLEKAIAAITKAYSIYPLPIYLYDLACFMEMAEKRDIAKRNFRTFLEKYSEFKPDKFSEVLMSQRDIEKAVSDAQSKTT
jgi:tetratricopeptide (TPR) repeat protein